MTILEFLKWLFIDYTHGWLIVFFMSLVGFFISLHIYSKNDRFKIWGTAGCMLFVFLFLIVLSLIELI